MRTAGFTITEGLGFRPCTRPLVSPVPFPTASCVERLRWLGMDSRPSVRGGSTAAFERGGFRSSGSGRSSRFDGKASTVRMIPHCHRPRGSCRLQAVTGASPPSVRSYWRFLKCGLATFRVASGSPLLASVFAGNVLCVYLGSTRLLCTFS